MLEIFANERGLQLSLADPTGPHSIFLIRGGKVSPKERTHGFLDLTSMMRPNPIAMSFSMHHQVNMHNMVIDGAEELSLNKTAIL